MAQQGWVDALPYLAWEDFSSPGPSGSQSPQAETQEALAAMQDWREAVPLLAAHYRQHGTGDFARYHAFRWVRAAHGGHLQGRCPS